jgi:fibronectin type 3 domain-containing protein
MADATLTVPRYFRAKGSDINHEVKLSWKFTNSRYVRGIEIYRSFNYDSGYVKIAQLPPTDTTYVDVVPVANENYYYYLQIQGPFEKSYPSAKIAAMFKKAGEKPAPPAETDAKTVPGGVKIYWSYTEPYLKGFFVFRYVYEKAEYEQVSGLIPACGSIYSFIDSSASLVGNHDYRYAVKAVNDVDQMSDLSVSATARPGIKASVETPVNLEVSDKEYGALLIWNDLSKSENNLLGYKIYRKESDEKNFTILASDSLLRSKNYFSDSTVVEGKSYTYAVSAIDFYGNESAKSLTAYYSRPQSIMAPPEITRAVNTADGIMLTWGQAENKNLTAYNIYRGLSENNTSLIGTVKAGNDQYLDTTAVNGQLYVYRITVVTGNKESDKSRGISARRNIQ